MPSLDIYRASSIVATVSIDEQTVLVKKLMSSDRVTANFISKTALSLELGDYIIVAGVNYYINVPPQVEKVNDQTHRYTILFESVLYDMFKKLLISTDGLNDFTYSGNAEDVLYFIIENMNQIYSGWAVGDVDDSELKTFEFVNDNCRTALTKLTEAYNFEFMLEGKTVHLKSAVGTVRDLTFKYGQGNGLYNLTSKPVESKTLVTRLYAYGSTKNLIYTYRNRAKRLVFEERYLEKNTDVYGIHEAHYTNEDIFPNRTAPITAVDGTYGWVEDSLLDFDINAFLAEGLTAKIVFKSGQLSGYEFEIWKYDHNTKRIYFNKLQERDDYLLPNTSFKPQVGDLYTLVDINMPASYVVVAEQNLKAAAQKYLDENCVPKSLYVVQLDPKYVKAEEITLNAGDLVKIEDAFLGIDRAIRINQITYPLVNPYKMTAIIADFIPYSLQEQVSRATISAARAIQNIKNTINNTTNTTIINSGDIINNGSNIKKININGQEYYWEKGFDNTGADLEVGDIIFGNNWNRYVFVDKWVYKGGIKELRDSWDEIETTDNTPIP